MLVPLTTGEVGLVHHHRFNPRDTAFNLSALLRITGPVDAARLAACIETVVNAVDAFSSTFVEVDGETFRHVDRQRVAKVEIVERAGDESEADFLARAQADAEFLHHTEVVPDRWPLFTCRLYISQGCVYMLHSAPHLLTDGYSVAMYYEAVSVLYNGAGPDDPALAELVASAGTVPRDRARPRDARTEAYFRSELQGLGSFEVPGLAQPRDDRGGVTGRILAFGVSRQSIDPALERSRIPVARVFLTAYAAMLKRLVAADRLAIGFAVPNRPAEHRRSIGCFVNTSPLVVDTPRTATLEALGREIEAKLFRLYRYQDFDASRIGNIAPRFTCLFTAYPEELGLALKDCDCAALPIPRTHLPAEIRLTVEMRRSDYWLVFDLGTYFDDIDVEAAYRPILAATLIDPALAIDAVQLGPARLGSLDQIQDLARRIDAAPHGAVGAFERVVARQGECCAVCFQAEAWTYEQLNTQANKMARSLAELAGDARQIVVAVERGHHAVALVLAVMKTGKCYVPVDVRLPPERRRAILAELERPFVVAEPDALGDAPGVSLADLLVACQDAPGHDLATDIRPDGDAYMIHTSGSTGAPKGVTLTHRNLMSLMVSGERVFGFSSIDVWTLFHSFSFDYSVWEMFGCLLHGGRLVVVDQAATQDLARFYALLRRERVNVLNHTPAVFKHLALEDGRAGGAITPRIVFLGGEALNFSTLEGWTQRHPLDRCQIVNLYGPTEGTVLVTYHALRPDDLARRRSIIGKPIDSSLVEIRMPDGQLAVRGVAGEITLSGLGIGPKGYLNRPSETAERFFQTPQGPAFRTGDLGRIAASGEIDFLGRMDRQIKVRGFRVEPGEVETILAKCNWVRECAVGLRASASEEADAVLVAYVVVDDQRCTPDTLRDFAKRRLPSYLVPSSFVLTAHIPTTLSGKVDFEALAAEAAEPVAVKGRTPIERWLFDLVAAKLGNGDFEPTDNLLDVGVTSLDAVDLVGTIRERFGADILSVTDLFEHSTIRALARRLDEPASGAPEDRGTERAITRRAMLAQRRSAVRQPEKVIDQ